MRATVWTVEDKGKLVRARVSTGQKKKDGSGEYDNFFWTALFLGDCKEYAAQLEKGDKIDITDMNLVVNAYGDKADTEIIVFNYTMRE